MTTISDALRVATNLCILHTACSFESGSMRDESSFRCLLFINLPNNFSTVSICILHSWPGWTRFGERLLELFIKNINTSALLPHVRILKSRSVSSMPWRAQEFWIAMSLLTTVSEPTKINHNCRIVQLPHQQKSLTSWFSAILLVIIQFLQVEKRNRADDRHTVHLLKETERHIELLEHFRWSTICKNAWNLNDLHLLHRSSNLINRYQCIAPHYYSFPSSQIRITSQFRQAPFHLTHTSWEDYFL